MKFAFSCLTLALLAGCATVPTGPSVMALPGTGKSFDQFRVDDMDCRQYAQLQAGGDANAGVRSAAVGTAIGAVAGAAFGGHDSAAAGAGTGLLVGSLVGAGDAQASSYSSQRRYDNAYVQCLYAPGEQVPVAHTPMQRQPEPTPVAPPAGAYPPPPPAGSPPPPPPGYGR